MTETNLFDRLLHRPIEIDPSTSHANGSSSDIQSNLNPDLLATLRNKLVLPVNGNSSKTPEWVAKIKCSENRKPLEDVIDSGCTDSTATRNCDETKDSSGRLVDPEKVFLGLNSLRIRLDNNSASLKKKNDVSCDTLVTAFQTNNSHCENVAFSLSDCERNDSKSLCNDTNLPDAFDGTDYDINSVMDQKEEPVQQIMTSDSDNHTVGDCESVDMIGDMLNPIILNSVRILVDWLVAEIESNSLCMASPVAAAEHTFLPEKTTSSVCDKACSSFILQPVKKRKKRRSAWRRRTRQTPASIQTTDTAETSTVTPISTSNYFVSESLESFLASSAAQIRFKISDRYIQKTKASELQAPFDDSFGRNVVSFQQAKLSVSVIKDNKCANDASISLAKNCIETSTLARQQNRSRKGIQQIQRSKPPNVAFSSAISKPLTRSFHSKQIKVNPSVTKNNRQRRHLLKQAFQLYKRCLTGTKRVETFAEAQEITVEDRFGTHTNNDKMPEPDIQEFEDAQHNSGQCRLESPDVLFFESEKIHQSQSLTSQQQKLESCSKTKKRVSKNQRKMQSAVLDPTNKIDLWTHKHRKSTNSKHNWDKHSCHGELNRLHNLCGFTKGDNVPLTFLLLKATRLIRHLEADVQKNMQTAKKLLRGQKTLYQSIISQAELAATSRLLKLEHT